MWISVAPGETGGYDLLLPRRFLPHGEPGGITLRYGAGSAAVTAGPLPPEAQAGAEADAGAHAGTEARADAAGVGTRARPVRVIAHARLLDRLCIRTEPVYQLTAGQDPADLEIGPVLGLLLGNRSHWYDDGYLQREPERVADVYPRTGGLFCAFSPRSLSLIDQAAYGLFYDPGAGRWRYGRLPLPAVMHRRSFHTVPSALARVQQVPALRLFNSRRYDKWELYQLLRHDEQFRHHLPETALLRNCCTLLDLLTRHPMVILKPADLSRGRGILLVERQPQLPGYRLIDSRPAGPPAIRLMDSDQLSALLQEELMGRPYLVQERINLATMEERPFDIRVAIQRGPDGQWSHWGIECRWAGAGNWVTNIAHGGRALSLAEAVAGAFGGALDPGETQERVLALARRLCECMDQTGEHFGEFGIDLALDVTGKLWFIEANVIPTFKGFSTLDPGLYRRLLAAPLRYAARVAGFGEELLEATAHDGDDLSGGGVGGEGAGDQPAF